MLVRKKISTKKLAIYISIIFFMISGAGFMLFKNKKLAVSKSTDVNLPTVFNNSAPAATPVVFKDNALGIGEVNNQTAAGPGQALDINKFNQSGGFNLDIFSSDKFKNLRANVFIIKESPELGKKNPFKPN